MKRITWIIIVCVVLLLGIFALWGDGNEGKKKEITGSIRIGAVLPLTGPAAAIGESIKETYEWRAEELRAEGLDIELLIEDGESNPVKSVSAFNKLVDIDGVDYVFTTLSSVSMMLKPLSEEKKVLLWSYAAHPDITTDSTYVLRHSNTVSYDAKGLAGSIISRKRKNVAILYQQDGWGVSLANELAQHLASSSIAVLKEGIDYTKSDFRANITKVLAARPDGVVNIAVGPAAALLVKQAREQGYAEDLFSSIGFLLSPGAQEIAGDAALDMFYTTYPPNEAFEDAYRARFAKEPTAFAFVAYTDVELFVHALRESDSRDPKDIADYIKGMGEYQGTYERALILPSGDIVVLTTIKKWPPEEDKRSQ